jgi:hypothetical protein
MGRIPRAETQKRIEHFMNIYAASNREIAHAR